MTCFSKQSGSGVSTSQSGRVLVVALALCLCCAPISADSRLKKPQKKEHTKTLSNTLEVKKTISLPFKPKVNPNRCTAELSVSYSQIADSARADATVAVSDCADAKGTYIVKVRSVAADGAERLQEFQEQWQLVARTEITQTHTYHLLGDPDLRSVRIGARSAQRCYCNSPAEAPDSSE